MSTAALTEFLGWCSVLNLGLLALTALAIVVASAPIQRLHAAMFSVPEAELPRMYFGYIAQYKIAIFVFNLVPYLALRISE